MPLHLYRLTLAVLIAATLLTAATPALAAERSWVRVTYPPDALQGLRDNVEACLDTVADLLGEYRIYLPQTVTVVVTADHEGYVRALMSYGYTREAAEKTAHHSSGISLSLRPVILLKGTDALKSNRQEVYRVLPHELFHQVQRQWGRLDTVNWMVEAAPELFQIKAADRAGIIPAAVNIAYQQQRVIRAKAVPSARQLGSKDYKTFSALSAQGYPVYAMSTLMLHRLVEDGGFDKIVYYYKLLHHGGDPDRTFLSVFNVPMAWFLGEADKYFTTLRQSQ